MTKRFLAIGTVVLIGALVLGAMAAWLVPGDAEAAQGKEGRTQADYGQLQGAGRGQDVGAEAADETGQGSIGDQDQGQSQGMRQGQGRSQGQRQEQGQGQGQEPVNHTPIGDGTYDEPLSESEIAALLMALDDEYKAWSVYDQVISDLGSARPFTNIQRAEENHIAALETLLDHYGLEMPENEWPGNVPAFDTLTEACEAGVEAEIENAALYDQLFAMVDNPDIVQVFTTLQQASETKHLPAFERCAQ